MKVSDFIRSIAEDSDMTLEQMGEKIGRGKSSSFCRTIRNDTLNANDLKKCVECTGEGFIILYKGLNVHIT